MLLSYTLNNMTAVQMAATPPVYAVQSVGADKWKIGADRLEWLDRFSNGQLKARKQPPSKNKKAKKIRSEKMNLPCGSGLQ